MMSPKLATDDQVVVWQAEGVLMEVLGCGPVEAAGVVRWRARAERRSVVETAAAVLGRTAERAASPPA
jgi:ANTAR domain